MVGHGGSSAGSYLADPTSPIPSHCASIVATSTVRVKVSIFAHMQYGYICITRQLAVDKTQFHTQQQILTFNNKKTTQSAIYNHNGAFPIPPVDAECPL